MKVSLWAEIRRLHEVEGLSQAAILLQERRRRELPSPTPLQPKRRELIEDIHLEEPDPGRYDRLCGDGGGQEPPDNQESLDQQEPPP
jgi:hypothetical protein